VFREPLPNNDTGECIYRHTDLFWLHYSSLQTHRRQDDLVSLLPFLSKYYSRIKTIVPFLNSVDLKSDQVANSSVDIATRLWAGQPRSRGSIPGRGKRFSSSPTGPDQFWGPPSLLYNQSGSDVELTIYLHVVTRLRMIEIHLHSSYAFIACLTN
jgi:hypothetical protein